MTDISPTHPELFAAHASALRRLANELVRCPTAAEDALQETWLRARNAPALPFTRLRAWLRRVLHNVVISQHRTELRRSVRERDVARPSHEPSALDLLERRETLRSVMDSVTELDDELQTVVFLRHFDGLPPRDIARQLGVTTEIVYRRLKTAHAQLRARLRSRHGRGDKAWRGALGALFGWPGSTSTAQLIWKGALAVSLNAKLALTAAGLVALAVPIFLVSNAGAPAAPAHQAAAAGDALDRSTGAMPATETEREQVETDTDASPIAAALDGREPYQFCMRVQTIDTADVIAPHKAIVLGPSLHHLNAAGKTDENGVLEIRWRGVNPTMDMLVSTSASATTLRRVQVESGTTAHIALLVTAPRVGTGNEWAFAGEIRGGVRAGHGHPEVEIEEDFVRFMRPVDQEARVSDSGGTISLSAGTFLIRSTTELPTDLDAPPKHRLAGQVFAADGQPADKARVLAQLGGTSRLTQTDSNGRYSFDKLAAGTWSLRAGGGDFGQAFGEVDVVNGGEAPTWDARLDRGKELRGRLLDEAGGVLSNWHVRAASATLYDSWADQTLSDENGYFAIPNVPDRAHVLHFRAAAPTGKPRARQPHLIAELWSTPAPIDFVVSSARVATGSVTLQFVGEPAQLTGLMARLWHTESDIGVEFDVGKDGAAKREYLAPGNYTLSVGGPCVAWQVVSTFDVVPGKVVDLGALSLTLHGSIDLPDGEDLAVVRIHETVLSKLVATSNRSLDQISMAMPDGDISQISVDSSSKFSFEATALQAIESVVVARPDSSHPAGKPIVVPLPSATPRPSTQIAPPADEPSHLRVPPGAYLVVSGDGFVREVAVAPGSSVVVEKR